MKKLLILMSALAGITAIAQGNPAFRTDAGLAAALEKQLVQASAEKPYYESTQTAALCKAWSSCTKWASEQYTADASFRITKAYKKTRRKTGRHVVHNETTLYVQAVQQGKTIYVKFTSPHISRRGKSYQYIASFPKDLSGGK